ncbi:MAG: glycoside hydrolase family 31 protein [Bacteroidales bacterium]|nr:glycoside hydrolase family 31 protein [Bacteroidales bacterium]
MKRTTSLFLFTLLFLIPCQSQELLDISWHGKEHRPSLMLIDGSLDAPLQFADGTAKSDGAIWFETAMGRVELKGEPWYIQNGEEEARVGWLLGSRKVLLRFTKEQGYYTFCLEAIPGDDILKWGFALNAQQDEFFTGLFERVVDGNQEESWKEGISEAMNLRGQEVDMLIKPTVSLYCPFYLSSAGYGLFMEGTWPGHYDFCKTDPERVKIEFEGSALKSRLYISRDPADIVRAHSLHVGPTIVPPRWAFLPWRWRDEHVNRTEYYDQTPVTAPYNSEVVEDVLMMEAFGIPCGVYWIDRPWAIGENGYNDFEWDPERFPEAEAMINWLHHRDMKFMLWIAPWVSGDMRIEARNKGYDQPMKYHIGVDSANAALLDFTNPEACRWWQEKGIEKVLRQGVDGFKLDRAEETILESREIILHDGRTAREVRNEFPVLYVKTVNESCQKILGDDFILIPRAGYTGSSKYSGFWGGDIGSPPEGLRAAIIALQRSSIIGFPIWGSDIGGYWQGDLDREVFARWLAFGCFNPIMEVGPTENRAPWNMDSKPHYDTELIAIWRLYARLHARLADYTHALAQEAHETGMPLVRPLFLMYPEQEGVWETWESFLYGQDILVYALWEKGVEEVDVALPAGNRWVDAWDGNVYEGGQTVTVETPLHKIPLFMREGSDVELGDLESLYRESLQKAKEKPDLENLERFSFFPSE